MLISMLKSRLFAWSRLFSRCLALLLMQMPMQTGVLFCQVIAPAKPAEQPFRFRRLGTEQGLAQNTVFDVLQDRKGFLWIATGDGLCRWDGYNVKTWRHDPKDSTSLSNFSVSSVLQDAQGNIWVNTLDGLNRLDVKTGTFERYYAPNRFQTKQWTTNGGYAQRVFLRKSDSSFPVLTNLGLCRINRRTKLLEPVPCSDGSDSIIKPHTDRLAFFPCSYPPLNDGSSLLMTFESYNPPLLQSQCVESQYTTKRL
jgi:hypothetical protein